MMMRDQMAAHPEFSLRTHVEAWLTSLAREAGEYAKSEMAEFGALLDENGEASVDHLSDEDVAAIMARALSE